MIALTHDEILELLAAYALDAVDADEAEAIDLHLRECPRCRAEVAELRETASALAIAHDPAPEHVWDSIAATLEPAPPAKMAKVLPLQARRRPRALSMVAAAAAVVVIAGLGVQLQRQADRVDRMESALEGQSVLAASLAASEHPDARHVELRSPDGIVLARAVLVPDGTGFLWAEGLPATADDRTYQLWAVVGDETVSAGVLGPSPDVAPFRVDGDVSALALTEEVEGGVVASMHKPSAVGEVEA